MKKMHFKTLLSTICMVCLFMGSSIACLAAEPESTSYVGTEEGHPLPIVPEDYDGVMPCAGVIFGPIAGTISTGNTIGTFSVPIEYSGHMIRVHWLCRAQSGANESAVYTMTVTGNGLSFTVLLPLSYEFSAYTIGDLPSGNYTYKISPYTNVSGNYTYGLQFFSY